MKRLTRSLAAAVLFASACALASEGAAKAGRYVLYENARIIIGDGSAPIENGAMLVENDTIARVGRKGDVSAPAGASRVDLTGKTIMPGIVLAHGHIGYLRGTTFARENYTRDNIVDQ